MTISEQLKGNLSCRLSPFYNRISESYLGNMWSFHTAGCPQGSRTADRLLCSSSAPPAAPAGGSSPCWQPYTLSPTGETQARYPIRHTTPLFHFLKCFFVVQTTVYIAVYLTGFLDHMHFRCGWKLYDVIGRKKKKNRKPHLKVSANVLPIWKLNIVCSLYLSLFIFVKWKLLNSATHSSLVYNTVQCYLHGGSSWLLSVVVVV